VSREVQLKFEWRPEGKTTGKPGHPGCGMVEMKVDFSTLNIVAAGDETTLSALHSLIVEALTSEVGLATMTTIRVDENSLVASKPGKGFQSILTGPAVKRQLSAPGLTTLSLSGTSMRH
jgi:hypothetical protein